MPEAPVAIHASVVIHEHGRVEGQYAVGGVGVLFAPVAHFERPVRTVALRNEPVAASMLVVGIEVVGLLAGAVGDECHVGRKEHVGESCRVERLALGVLVHFQNLTVVAPLVEAIDRGRPHHEFAPAVVGDAAVVRTIDIHTLFAGLVWIFKHIGLPIGYVLPEWEIGVADCREFLLDGFRFAGT